MPLNDDHEGGWGDDADDDVVVVAVENGDEGGVGEKMFLDGADEAATPVDGTQYGPRKQTTTTAATATIRQLVARILRVGVPEMLSCLVRKETAIAAASFITFDILASASAPTRDFLVCFVSHLSVRNLETYTRTLEV